MFDIITRIKWYDKFDQVTIELSSGDQLLASGENKAEAVQRLTAKIDGQIAALTAAKHTLADL